MADLKRTITDDNQTLVTTSMEAFKSYNLYYTQSMLNVTFHEGDRSSPIIYYAQSKLRKSRPVFLIHEGSETGTILSHVQCPWHAVKTMYIGHGDATDKESQEKLARDHVFRSSDYHFTSEKKNYDWVKDKGKFAASAFQCIDEDGRALATMLSGGAFNWSKAGEVKIDQNISLNLQHMLLAGAIGIWTLEGLSYKSLVAAY